MLWEEKQGKEKLSEWLCFTFSSRDHTLPKRIFKLSDWIKFKLDCDLIFFSPANHLMGFGRDIRGRDIGREIHHLNCSVLFCKVRFLLGWAFQKKKRASGRYLPFSRPLSFPHPCFLVCLWVWKVVREFELVSIAYLLLCDFPFSPLWRMLSRQEGF